MKKDTKEQLEKETIFNELNPVRQRNTALEVLKKAKVMEAEKLAKGKKWHVSADGKTSYLR